MRLFASCALVAVVAAGPVPREAGAATATVSSILPNGITVVSRQRAGSQVLAIDLAVRAGARYETPETSSATRFLESALLLGTEQWPTRDALTRVISGRGGDLSCWQLARGEAIYKPRWDNGGRVAKACKL